MRSATVAVVFRGDTVNTALRLQWLADPGVVLVDDVTRRASEAAIAYEDAGTHAVKGREQPVHAWRALRVVGGARRSVGLEAPFAGREPELQRAEPPDDPEQADEAWAIFERFGATPSLDRCRAFAAEVAA
jgi:hypothetical protein